MGDTLVPAGELKLKNYIKKYSMNKEQWFWNIIEESDTNREILKNILTEFNKDELINFQEIFVDFSSVLQVFPYAQYMEESEDGIEDISHWVVSRGQEFYNHIVNNPQEIPFSLGDNSMQDLYGIADEVCLEKYDDVTGIY